MPKMQRFSLKTEFCRLLGVIFLLMAAGPAGATVLWSHPDVVFVCETNQVIMRGPVKPQGTNSSGTLYFRIRLDSLADTATKVSKHYEAGFMLMENGREHLGVGSSREALAYSCLNVPKAPKGFQDLNSSVPDLFSHEYIRARAPRYVVLKIEYVPENDARVTAWLNPDLSQGATEFNQASNCVVHFETDATFDEFSVMYRGGGAGWKFSQMMVATSFEDLLLQPVWFQKWFLLLVAVGLPTLIVGPVWLLERRRARLRIQHLEQEQVVAAERARIAQDIHDEVGTSLTKISKLTEMLAAETSGSETQRALTGNIAGTLQDTIRAMDEIVWAINPKNDTLKETADYLVFFAEDFLRHTGIACELDVPLTLPDMQLPAETRHTLFMAAKEALNNAVKHAAPARIRLSLTVAADHWLTLEIADDGKGFDPASPSEGNGLENMRRRLEAIGGEYVLQSAPNAGTTVRLRLQLSPSKGGSR